MTARSVLTNLAGNRAAPAEEITGPSVLKPLPPAGTFLRILGVNYVHLKTDDDGDLYVTEHGQPFLEHLRPCNWYESPWFQEKRQRLAGTSVVYRVPTRPVKGHACPSIDLVVKWSRVGEDVPINTFTLNCAINAEFNTPFEEFSLVEELREAAHGPRELRILTQKPLAIYVPPERMQLWQTGRSRERVLRRVARHAGVEIDILRSYILLYGWIDGPDAVEAYQRSMMDKQAQEAQLAALTQAVGEELRQKGFFVADNKPTHFILRIDRRTGQIRRRRDGRVLYALVDYELLARTPEHDEAVKRAGRNKYLLLQRDRFTPPPVTFPSHLKPASVLGVDYIYGRAESTNGILWVVGRNPELFGYFLPERWRSKQIQLSQSNRTWYTQTKDRIHLVWKVSRVGDLPPGDLGEQRYKLLLAHGYNSPFEEVALALEMQARGLRTTYPRAIYATGQLNELAGSMLDDRRFKALADTRSPEELPVLDPRCDYITIWGYWRGLEDSQAPEEVGHWNPIDARQACAIGIIDARELEQIIERQRASLAAAGFEDVNLAGDHILLSYIPGGSIKRDETGQYELRHCNMEMVRRL